MKMRLVVDDECHGYFPASLWAEELRNTGAYCRVKQDWGRVRAWVKADFAPRSDDVGQNDA